MNLDFQTVIVREPSVMKSRRKGSMHRRCQTSCINEEVFEKKELVDKKYNQTFSIGEKFYSKKLSTSKGVYKDNSTSGNKAGQFSERSWNFGPWDVRKENV